LPGIWIDSYLAASLKQFLNADGGIITRPSLVTCMRIRQQRFSWSALVSRSPRGSLKCLLWL